MGDYKSRNNSVDRLEQNWPEEKRLIDEKNRNNRWTGAERPSKKQAGRTTMVNRREKSTWNLTPPYIRNKTVLSLLGVSKAFLKSMVRSVNGMLRKLYIDAGSIMHMNNYIDLKKSQEFPDFVGRQKWTSTA